jgi:hypothetical protein
MSEDLELLKEYVWGMGLDKSNSFTEEDLQELKSVLKDAGEFGLVNFLNGLNDPSELLDYIGEEDD